MACTTKYGFLKVYVKKTQKNWNTSGVNNMKRLTGDLLSALWIMVESYILIHSSVRIPAVTFCTKSQTFQTDKSHHVGISS